MTTSQIWVYIEHRLGKIELSSLQLITKAKEIAGNKPVVAVLCASDSDALVNEVIRYAPDQIVVIPNDPSNEMEAADLLAQLAKRSQPNSILFGATVLGRAIAPRLQAKLLTGLTADCLDLHFQDDVLVQTKPSYGDNIMCEIICPNHRPQMATVRPNTFIAKVVENASVEITVVNDLTVTPDRRVEVIEEIVPELNSDSITEADKIIAFGRGAADTATIAKIEETAKSLGAKVAITRPLNDLPNYSVAEQIGQSGQTVAPKLLINLGIHGAVQYISGMTNAQTVVSVNTKENAPIFEVSDYAYVGDAKAFITELQKQLP